MTSGNEPKHPEAAWLQAVDELVSGVQELISETGGLNLYTSQVCLEDLRLLADRVRGVDAHSRTQNKVAEADVSGTFGANPRASSNNGSAAVATSRSFSLARPM